MYSYTIIPLDTEHINEICLDIKEQYEKGIANLALFAMKVEPIGNPIIDRVSEFSDKYILFRDKLAEYGLKCGILVQSTIGHGTVLDDVLTFQPYVNLTDGKEEYISCPGDDGFVSYIRKTMERLAALSPEMIMVDDDFRLVAHKHGRGCACPYHMAEFNRLAGTNYNREELYECLLSNSADSDKYKKIFADTQTDSRIKAAKAMREGIDKVNPGLQGAFCTCGNEPAGEIARILAGKGNKSILRLNNGNYAQNVTRTITRGFTRIAIPKNLFCNKVDIYLAETDTFPRNRYSTSATFLHNHYTGSILEGVQGAKHFITRLRQYEPSSGIAYRKILEKYAGFYNELERIVANIRWQGCKIPIPSKIEYSVENVAYDTSWMTNFLERMGFPVYFSNDDGGVFFMSGNDPKYFSEEELRPFFKGTLVLSSDAAKYLEEAGFKDLLGVSVCECSGTLPTGEIICKNNIRTELQTDIKKLIPANDNVEIGSYACIFNEVKGTEKLFPSSTIYKNPIGGTTVVFGGTPKSDHFWPSTYSLLNESRKNQFVEILKDADCLPIYYPGDADVYLKAGTESDGTTMVAFFNIGLDVLENIVLISEKDISEAQILTSEGIRRDIKFSKKDKTYTFDVSAMVFTPVILFLK